MEDNNFQLINNSDDWKYFTIVPNYILNHSSLYDRALYIEMKRTAGPNNRCWLSRSELVKRTGMSNGQVSISLKYLLEHGWIKSVGSKQGKTKPITVYELVDIWKLNTDYYESKKKKDSPSSGLSFGILQKIVHTVDLDSPQKDSYIIKLNNKEIKKDIYTDPAEPRSAKTVLYSIILEAWNSQNIIQHKKITDKMKRAINGRIRDGYSMGEITKTIENYNTILTDESCFFKYKWSLHKFLDRGFESFKDLEIAHTNYTKHKNEQEEFEYLKQNNLLQ